MRYSSLFCRINILPWVYFFFEDKLLSYLASSATRWKLLSIFSDNMVHTTFIAKCTATLHTFYSICKSSSLVAIAMYR